MEEQTFIANNLDIFIWIIATIISVYIPVGIVFLQDIGKDNKTFKEFDTKVIKEKSINLKQIILFIILYFIVLLLWNNYLQLNLQQVILFLTIVIILLYGICNNLFSIYKWFSHKWKYQIRYNYLIKEKNSNIRYNLFKNTDNIEDWELILKAYFTVLKYEQDREIISSLLEIFPLSDGYNDIYIKLFLNKWRQSNIFSELLLLYYKSWSKEQLDNTNNLWREEQIIHNIFQFHFLKIEHSEYHAFIRLINIHLTEVENINQYQIYLSDNILSIILESKNLILDHEFIDQIVKGTHKFKIEHMSYSNSKVYMTINRINNKVITTDSNNYMKEIDNVLQRFFPWIDLRYFSSLLCFYVIYSVDKNKVYEYSNHKRIFWIFQFPQSFSLLPWWSNRKERINKQEIERIKYTTKLFKELFEWYNIDLSKKAITKDLNEVINLLENEISEDQKIILNNLKSCLEEFLKYWF
jgi:hypothetical protein